MNMTLRKADPNQGAVENLKMRMEAQVHSQSAGSPSKDGGLSSGATAGISIGVTLGIGLLVIGIFATCRRRKRTSINASRSEYQTFNNS